MISRHPYQSLRAFLCQSYIMLFCLTFFITAKPILVVVLHLIDTEYELCESMSEEEETEENKEIEDAEEKEKIEDAEEREHKLYCSEYMDWNYSPQITVFDPESSKYADIYKHIRDVDLEVPSPPPKNC